MPLILFLLLALPLLANAAYLTGASSNILYINEARAINSSFSSGKSTIAASVRVAGQVLPYTLTARPAANAAKYAIGLARANPYLIVGSIAAYFLLEGIRPDGNIVTLPPGAITQTLIDSCVGQPIYSGAGGASCNNPSVLCPGEQIWSIYPTYADCYPSRVHRPYTVCTVPNCAVTPSITSPATQADYDRLATHSLPDDAASAISAWSDGLPVSFDPAPTITIPISSPFTQPDGSTAREYAHVTPDPSPTDPLRVRVDTSTQQSTDPQGQPLATPVISPTTTADKTPDQCEKYPDSVGCMAQGSIPASDAIGTKTISVAAITPVSISSVGASCPAPFVISTSHGSISFDWEPLCRYADAMRPVVLAMAWFGAAFIIAGMRNQSEATS